MACKRLVQLPLDFRFEAKSVMADSDLFKRLSKVSLPMVLPEHIYYNQVLIGHFSNSLFLTKHK